MFAHAPALGAATLKLVFALLNETALDPVLRELVELLLLIGYFRMISAVMATLEVEVELPFGAKVLASLK